METQKRLQHALLLGLFFGTLTSAQVAVQIDLDGARPLNEALFKIDELFGVPVVYEEVPLKYPGYLINGQARGMAPDRNYPLGGELHVRLSDNEQSGANALRTVLDAYAASELPGEYAISLRSDTVCILPAKVLDANGHEATVSPILKTAITLPYALRTVQDTAVSLVEALTKATGKKIVLLNQPYRYETVTWGADNEPAVDALVHLGDEIGPVTFRLLYEPSDGNYYFSLTPVSPVDGNPIQTPAQATPLKTSPFFVREKQ